MSKGSTLILVGFLSNATSVEELSLSTIMISLILVSRYLNGARIIDNLVKEDEEQVEEDKDFNLLRPREIGPYAPKLLTIPYTITNLSFKE